MDGFTFFMEGWAKLARQHGPNSGNFISFNHRFKVGRPTQPASSGGLDWALVELGTALSSASPPFLVWRKLDFSRDVTVCTSSLEGGRQRAEG